MFHCAVSSARTMYAARASRRCDRGIAAYAVGLTIILPPVMFWMVNRIPLLTTLFSM